VTDSDVISSEADGTSLSLLERVKNQDGAAWQRLGELYGPLILHWCRLRGLQEADAENVRQEVFLAVHRAVGEFQREPPRLTFRGWLRTITKNKIIDHLRQVGKLPDAVGGDEWQQRIEALSADLPDDDSSAHEEKSLLVRRALDLLQTDFEPQTWTAFWRVRIDGLPAQAVAEELQTSTSAVHTACYRVRNRLEAEFAGLIED
jgi:RNA polymerase sigma factor (sigma-70 family)